MRQFTRQIRTVLAAAALAGLAVPALADDPSGTWLRENGASRVKIAKCGNAYCGHITWLKDTGGLAKVGQRVFYDMMPNGENAWKGSAFNPEDGKTYSGKMTLSGTGSPLPAVRSAASSARASTGRRRTEFVGPRI